MTEPLDLAPIQARTNAATPGRWYLQPNYGPHFVASEMAGYEHGIGTLNFGEGDQADADRAFVLHAHADMTNLIAEVERLRAALHAGRALHAETPLYKLAEDCPHGCPEEGDPSAEHWDERHPLGMDQTGYTADRLCLDSPLGRSVCGTCTDPSYPEDPAQWPCPTATALGLTPAATAR